MTTTLSAVRLYSATSLRVHLAPATDFMAGPLPADTQVVFIQHTDTDTGRRQRLLDTLQISPHQPPVPACSARHFLHSGPSWRGFYPSPHRSIRATPWPSHSLPGCHQEFPCLQVSMH